MTLQQKYNQLIKAMGNTSRFKSSMRMLRMSEEALSEIEEFESIIGEFATLIQRRINAEGAKTVYEND